MVLLLQLAKRGPAKKNTKMVSNVPEGFLPVQDDAKSKLAEELSRIRVAESEEFIMPLKLEENKPIPQCRQYDVADLMIPVQTSAKPAGNAPIKGLYSILSLRMQQHKIILLN